MPNARPPLLSTTWTDNLTGRRGYLVVDRLVRGVCSGGLRMRAGCTLEEVAGLARGMTRKEALHYDPDPAPGTSPARYVPLGGAKGGQTGVGSNVTPGGPKGSAASGSTATGRASGLTDPSGSSSLGNEGDPGSDAGSGPTRGSGGPT